MPHRLALIAKTPEISLVTVSQTNDHGDASPEQPIRTLTRAQAIKILSNIVGDERDDELHRFLSMNYGSQVMFSPSDIQSAAQNCGITIKEDGVAVALDAYFREHGITSQHR